MGISRLLEGKRCVLAGTGSLADAIFKGVNDHGATCLQISDPPGSLATDPGAASAIERAVSTLGSLDVLITAFSTRADRPFLEIGDDWDLVLDENLTCAFFVAREAARRMTDNGCGIIVHVSSDAAAQPGPRMASFAAAKAAVQMMATGMALDLAPHGVRVCSVTAPDTRPQLGRFAPADADVASAVAFCASDKASYVLGSNFSLMPVAAFRGP
jgi:NAD(P)-dependent dehydrogenase (short-subunit alcohol dehydrogenase family)